MPIGLRKLSLPSKPVAEDVRKAGVYVYSIYIYIYMCIICIHVCMYLFMYLCIYVSMYVYMIYDDYISIIHTCTPRVLLAGRISLFKINLIVLFNRFAHSAGPHQLVGGLVGGFVAVLLSCCPAVLLR